MRFGWFVVVAGCGHFDFSAANDAGGSDVDVALIDARIDAMGMPDGIAPSTCGGQSVILCEGFEAPLSTAWTLFQTEGTVGTAATRPFRGAGSLQSTTNAVTGTTSPEAAVRAYVNTTGTGTVYARIWAYAPSLFPSSYDQFLTFADGSGGGIALARDASGALVSNDFTAGGMYRVSATPMPLDRWVCLVLQVPTNQTGMSRVFLDGIELTDLAQPNPPQTTPDQIYVGQTWGGITGLPARTVWFDELIVNTSPITCAQ